MDSNAYLQIQNVVKKFDDMLAVDHVSLDIQKNEIFALLGSSGCGKSTLLRMLAGMESPTSGRIILDGEDITALPPYKRPINMMFQSYALFPHMTVEQNVAFGLKQDGLPKAEIVSRVEAMLDLVQMRRYAKRKPHQLSGGQQQRVALARSLVKRPKLLLLDEPLGALDKQLREQTQLELVNVIEKVGVTCIMVTHDQEEAMTMATRIGVMSEGGLMQVGDPHDVYEFPNCKFVAEFIGSTNFFSGTLDEYAPEHAVVSVDELERGLYVSHGVTGRMGMPVSVSIRPERISVSRAAPTAAYNWSEGDVLDIAYYGSHSSYYVKLASGRVVQAQSATLRWQDEPAPTWGDHVYLEWAGNACVVLTA